MAETIISKPCSKCKSVKSLSEFYRQPSKPDGRHNQCKTCRDIYLVAYRKNRKEHYREYLKEYGSKYRQTQHGKDLQKGYAKEFFRRHPDRRKAYDAIHHAIEAGRMQPATYYPCTYCTEQAEQYHHPNGYAKAHWLDVIPACTICHKAIHIISL